MKRVVVDPISRIEGHLRVEIKVDEASGKVEDALSSGTAWRGIELVAKDRDPRDLWNYIITHNTLKLVGNGLIFVAKPYHIFLIWLII